MRTVVPGHVGLVVAPEWMFSPELADDTLQAVLTEWTLPPIDVWAVFPSGRMATTKARAFVAFVEHRLGEGGAGTQFEQSSTHAFAVAFSSTGNMSLASGRRV
jgi:DNA-binding transcriptional LysR family regulator